MLNETPNIEGTKTPKGVFALPSNNHKTPVNNICYVDLNDLTRPVIRHLGVLIEPSNPKVAKILFKSLSNKRVTSFDRHLLEVLFDQHVIDATTFALSVAKDTDKAFSKPKMVNWLSGILAIFEPVVGEERLQLDREYRDTLADELLEAETPISFRAEQNHQQEDGGDGLDDEVAERRGPVDLAVTQPNSAKTFQEDKVPPYQRAKTSDLVTLMDDAAQAWSEIEADLAAALESEPTKYRLARIYWSVYSAVKSPEVFRKLNFDAKRQKPIVTLKRGSTNVDYQLAAKFLHQKVRKIRGLTEKGARTNYHRWAKAFRWAGDEGIDNEDLFRKRLDTTSINEMERQYDSRKDGPNKDDQDRLSDKKAAEDDADVQESPEAEGLKADKVTLMLNRLQLMRLKVAISRLPANDHDKEELLEMIEQALSGPPTINP